MSIAVRLVHSVGQGRTHLVMYDHADDDLLKHAHWHVHQHGYAADSNCKMMHHYLLPPVAGQEVDHINGRRTDNRRANLRATDRAGNQQNRKLNANNTSGYKGVHYSINGRGGKWRGHISCRKKAITKSFYTKDEAVAWVRAKREELHGEYARHA